MATAAWVLLIASLSLVVYVYIGYPVLLLVISLFYRRRARQPGYYPKVSVVIAAHNEQSSIASKLNNTLNLDYPREHLEVLVASDCSTDRTDEIVASISAVEPRVRLLRVEPRRGKTIAQNKAVEHCRGDVIVFSDATTIYHRDAVKYLAFHYDDPSVGAVSGRYQYFDPDGRSPTGLGSIAFWNYENVIKKLQSRIKTLTGCSGCIYSVRRDLYVPLPADACSDLVEPLEVVRAGRRVVFEDRAVAYEETTRSATQEFHMRVRVIAQGILALVAMRELLNPLRHGWISFQLLSHKVFRWLVLFALIGLLVSSLMLSERPWALALLLAQMVFYAAALVPAVFRLNGRWRWLTIPLYVCTVNLAVLFSLVQLFRGVRFATWDSPRYQSR